MSEYLSVLIAILILSTPFAINQEASEIDEEQKRMEQFGGGGGSLEEQCGSITFENMFEYSHANFDIIISEDWKTAEVKADAWVVKIKRKLKEAWLSPLKYKQTTKI